jgi:hypothetical protein
VQTRLQIDKRGGPALGHKHRRQRYPSHYNVLEASPFEPIHWTHRACLEDYRVKTHDRGSSTTTVNDTKRQTHVFSIMTDSPRLDSSKR